MQQFKCESFIFSLLDREAVAEYTFLVTATDGGREVVRTSSAKVTILVTDANDHTPGECLHYNNFVFSQ